MYVRIRNDLEFLASRLFRAQREYERARARGDVERINQSRVKLSAIMAERDRLLGTLYKRAPEDLRMTGS